MAKTIILDPGHGGPEPGAVYEGRREKDDTLQLAYDLGNALERRGFQVEYTRVSDVYDTPYEKAAIANRSGADLLLSLHRNAMPVPGTASGIESLVYAMDTTAALFAENINQELHAVGWTNLGVKERPGLVVLRQSEMPAVLIEAGFIDNEGDNEFFDANLAATADAIADGVLRTFEQLENRRPANGEEPGFYMVQTGAFRRREYAEEQLEELKEQGYPAFLVAKDGVYYVRAGAFRELNHAVDQERALRRQGYGTLLIRT